MFAAGLATFSGPFSQVKQPSEFSFDNALSTPSTKASKGHSARAPVAGDREESNARPCLSQAT